MQRHHGSAMLHGWKLNTENTVNTESISRHSRMSNCRADRPIDERMNSGDDMDDEDDRDDEVDMDNEDDRRNILVYLSSKTRRAPCTPLPLRLGAYSERSTCRNHSITLHGVSSVGMGVAGSGDGGV